jgi:hypothetical protein
MTHAVLDDGFDDHPRYASCDLARIGLVATAITYANRHLTDGVIPAAWPKRRWGRAGEAAARFLVEEGIWLRRDDGDFEIDGFLDHNPSKAEVLAQRAESLDAKVRAGKVGGVRSGIVRRAKAAAEAAAKQTRSTNEADAKRTPSEDEANAKQNEALSSPLLSSPSLSNPEEKAASDSASASSGLGLALVEAFIAGVNETGNDQSVPRGPPLIALGDALRARTRRLPTAEARTEAAALGRRWPAACGGVPLAHFKAVDWLNEGAPDPWRPPRGTGVQPQRPPPGGSLWKPGELAGRDPTPRPRRTMP